MKYKWIMACMAMGLGMISVGSGAPAKPAGYPGNTLPSERRQLTIPRPDVIEKVMVKPGDAVKKGQLLVEEDTREQVQKVKITQLEAESNAEVKSAEVMVQVSIVKLASSEVEFKRVEEMFNKNVATASEFDKAKLEVDTDKLGIEKAKSDLEIAKKKSEQQKLNLDLEKASLDRMRIYSPFDGLVEDVLLKEGEVVDPGKPVVVVVKNDPLWVEVFVDTAISLKMKLGQEVKVKYDMEEQARTGTVIYMNPVAEAGSKMQKIRLELANKENLPAGLPVTVFP